MDIFVMSSVSERILARMKELNLQQVDLIELTGLSKGTVSKWISGINTPSGKSITSLSKALKTSPEWILDGEGLKNLGGPVKDEDEKGFHNVRFNGKKLTRIPVLDFVQAGLWREVAYDGGEPKGYTFTTYENRDPSTVFTVTVEGMSMYPDFQPGDDIVIDASVSPQPGDYVVAQNGDYEVTFKKYRVVGFDEHGREVFELVPINPDFPVHNSQKHPISVIGVVVQHHREFRK